MSCTLCIKHKVKARNGAGVWTSKLCTSISEQAVKRHQNSQMHMDALFRESQSRTTNIANAIAGTLTLERKAFDAALRILHWLCKEEIAHTTKFKELVHLVKDLGCNYLSHLNKVIMIIFALTEQSIMDISGLISVFFLPL